MPSWSSRSSRKDFQRRPAKSFLVVEVDLHDIIRDEALLLGEGEHRLVDADEEGDGRLQHVEQPRGEDGDVHVLPAEGEE